MRHTNNIEQELKIQLNEAQYNLLCGLTDAKPQLQTNHYFGYDSMPIDLMVRVRHKCEGFYLCYKHKMSHVDGISVCDEREREISRELFDDMQQRGIAKAQLKNLVDAEVTQDLHYLGSLETLRTKFHLQGWTLEVDKNNYLGRTDYELECENTSMQSLNDLTRYLYDNFAIANNPSISKFARFLQASKLR